MKERGNTTNYSQLLAGTRNCVYVWLCKIHNFDMMMVKQTKPLSAVPPHYRAVPSSGCETQFILRTNPDKSESDPVIGIITITSIFVEMI